MKLIKKLNTSFNKSIVIQSVDTNLWLKIKSYSTEEKEKSRARKLEEDVNKTKQKMKNTKFVFDEELSKKEPEEIIKNINKKYERMIEEEKVKEYIGQSSSKSFISNFITFFLIFFFPYNGYVYLRKKGEIKEDNRQAQLKKKELLNVLFSKEEAFNSLQTSFVNNFNIQIQKEIGKSQVKIKEAKQIDPISQKIVDNFFNKAAEN
eukprot:TRINITY_DN11894_c0_g1_i1.p1 TRINITY_DN11894_c0_g1~~TRINITY_DN11894_c0_g1_i1.p1  ORF type:complete len:206 (-),score=87.43 TRINITY_DN11894_c0_g1_i1:63-680(-)